MPENRSSGAFGFLTVVAHEAWGHTGGYLILNASGRPLEFHCTAPVRPNRAQEILYGQTLLPYLYGEQIGPTLVRRGSVEPVALFTDLAPVLALGESLATPLVWVREAGEPDSATGAMLARWRVDPVQVTGRPLQCYHWNASELALPGDSEQAGERLLAALAQSSIVDLSEPFGRIRDALAEAQRGRSGEARTGTEPSS